MLSFRKFPAKKSLVLCWVLYVAGNVVEFWTDWATYGGSDFRTVGSGLALASVLILSFAWWRYYPRSCDASFPISRVTTVNSPFELTVGLSSYQNPTVGKAPTVAALPLK